MVRFMVIDNCIFLASPCCAPVSALQGKPAVASQGLFAFKSQI